MTDDNPAYRCFVCEKPIRGAHAWVDSSERVVLCDGDPPISAVEGTPIGSLTCHARYMIEAKSSGVMGRVPVSEIHRYV